MARPVANEVVVWLLFSFSFRESLRPRSVLEHSSPDPTGVLSFTLTPTGGSGRDSEESSTKPDVKDAASIKS